MNKSKNNASNEEDAKINSSETSEEETSETEEEEEEETEEDSSLKKNEIDYEAELEAEIKRGKPDPLKAREAFKKREAKRKEEEFEEEDEEDEENKPLTKKDFEQMLAKERHLIHREVYADRTEEIAKEIASSDAEARLIVEIHKNRVFPDNLSLRDQLEEAQAIANRKRLVSEKSELARALKSKETTSKNFASSYQEGLPSPAPKISKDLEASMKRAGFVYDNKQKVWKKKLPSGKFLIKDTKLPKDKQTYLV